MASPCVPTSPGTHANVAQSRESAASECLRVFYGAVIPPTHTRRSRDLSASCRDDERLVAKLRYDALGLASYLAIKEAVQTVVLLLRPTLTQPAMNGG